jgi:hypothetical protein
MNEERHDFTYDLKKTIGEYVELQREVVEQMTVTESIAQGIHDAVDQAIHAIKAPVDPRIAIAVSRFRSLPEEYLEPALELFTARAFQELLPDMVRLEKRVEELIGLAHEAAPSERAGAVLSNIVRYYLLGLDAETIAMCRTALDISVSDVINSLDTKASAKPASMRKRLELLEAAGKLSGLARADALEVWNQGNEVLHSNPIDVNSAPDVVAKALRVIGAMFPPADASH